jgi:hypothetical protein
MPIDDFVLLLPTRGMGHGPEELQLRLLAKYLQLMNENNQLPAVICLYTEGVKLVTEDSPVLNQLSMLEGKGVHMADILEAQLKTKKVIPL